MIVNMMTTGEDYSASGDGFSDDYSDTWYMITGQKTSCTQLFFMKTSIILYFTQSPEQYVNVNT